MARLPDSKAMWAGALGVAGLALVIIVLGAFSPLWSHRVPNDPTTKGSAPGAIPAASPGGLLASPSVSATAPQPGGSQGDGNGSVTRPGDSGAGDGAKPGATDRPAEDAPFLLDYADMTVLMPSVLENFEIGPAVQTVGDITVSASPLYAASPVSRILWSAHDAATPAAASRAIKKTTAVLYSHDRKTVSVHGVPAYFGTDGTRFAAISFARGRYRFEVLVTAKGVDPAKTLRIATQAAEALPTTPRK